MLYSIQSLYILLKVCASAYGAETIIVPPDGEVCVRMWMHLCSRGHLWEVEELGFEPRAMVLVIGDYCRPIGNYRLVI